jgi:hypothetical protein
MSKNTRQKAIEQEGRIVLAINALKKGQITKIRQAARLYDVPSSTLHDRFHGRTERASTRANNLRLGKTEEESLKKWIISLASRGAAPRPSAIQAMADILLSKRGEPTPQRNVGVNWVSSFLRRNKDIKTRYLRRYNYQRAKCEDPKLIREFFEAFHKTVMDYGISDDDIYNFDETGFAMGIIATARVVTMSDNIGKPVVLQPGNREWITSIEAINAAGWALPPMILLKAKTYQGSWFEDPLIPGDWRLQTSPNGWTTDEIGLDWLINHFEPYTRDRTVGNHRLLVLDGHSSHLSPKFDDFCSQHKIIPICMPAHSSHLLQPLDVSCFSVLKRSYGRLIENQMRLGINHISKVDFLSVYPQARSEAFRTSNIQNGFMATGLVPYDPRRVLSTLQVQLKTPTPPGTSHSMNSNSNWAPETPLNIIGLQKQSNTIKAMLKRRTHSPPTPTKQALDQLVKGCQLAMHSAVILARENQDLRAANEKQVKNSKKSKKQIPHQGSLTIKEGAQLLQAAQMADEAMEEVNLPEASDALNTRQRAPPRCTNCHLIGHKRTQCMQQPR